MRRAYTATLHHIQGIHSIGRLARKVIKVIFATEVIGIGWVGSHKLQIAKTSLRLKAAMEIVRLQMH